MTMPFVLAGVSHRTAEVELREQLAFAHGELTTALAELGACTAVAEGMILSTCNRVEILVFAEQGEPDLVSFLARRSRLTARDLQSRIYLHRGEEAVRHLFRVASSLDSMVVGEAQILGQLKEAFALARGCGCARTQLDFLLSRAFAVAKRVRTETVIGSSSVSIASAAVDLAKKIFGSLDGRTVLLVGAGKMTELAMRHLRANGAGETLVVNRTPERAQDLARRFSGKAISFESLRDAAPHADIVLTSTGSAEPIFRRADGEAFMQRRRNRPMFFIDIAVPRDVEPAMNEVDGIFVYDIDDLQQVIATNRADRSKEADRAESIVAEEVGRFRERLREMHVVPTIISLQDSMELMRQAEVDRMRSRLGHLSAQQEEAIEALTRGIVTKVLHSPITALKSAAKAEAAESLVQHAERLFGLGSKKKDSAKA
ncbi:MAG: glutamyl-tRNA reductase [Acidobacteriaceae bacterium]